MKKLFIYLTMLALLIAGCGKKPEVADNQTQPQTVRVSSAPTYDRTTVSRQLMDGANTYAMCYAENGFFYYVFGANAQGENEYRFFFQPYDDVNVGSYCNVKEGYVRDFAARDENGLAVLCIGDAATILEYASMGSTPREISLDNAFNEMESFPKLLARQDGGYVIAVGDKASFLDEKGSVAGETKLHGTVYSLTSAKDGEVYAVTESDASGRVCRGLEKLTEGKSESEVVRDPAEGVFGIFPFENGFVSLYSSYMAYFEAGKAQEENLVDFERQGILSSQIQAVFGNKKEIKLVSVDQASTDLKALTFTLTLREDAAEAQMTEKAKDEPEKYAPDGRRIVRVAIPEACQFQVEFHAKKYNQESDKSLVQVERFKGSLEDYLGKGNRPDVIMFSDHTEIAAYVQKGVLVNLLPMFEAWEPEELEGMIPKAKELLGVGEENAMYAMSARFRMLLRVSNGAEKEENGTCDAISYLCWYDDFMEQGEFVGLGTVENILYANIPFYYDESSAQASFSSETFKELMKAYKGLREKHQGNVSASGRLFFEREIAKGPWWRATYRIEALTEPNISVEGLPGPAGEDCVYIRLDDPLSILRTSDCQQEAFDFIAYYTSLREPLIKGYSEKDYGKGGTTMAMFSVWEKYLREEIYETDEPYVCIGKDKVFYPYYYTDEQIGHLKQLITKAVPVTKAQGEIYEMLLEEMEAYWQEDKSLEAACETLQ
ncbi:MAG: hypothetical protein II139_01170, partial [Lachnospiraceae bacterium]|nr:hypothetical protein [Lachnospiraceae bacterium]